MIISSTTVETTTNLQGTEDVLMKLDESASAFVLGNLIKQYANPYLAALREYASNARDSHAAVGSTRPIEISLPSSLSPSLVIEDFGLGLSRDGLKLYGQFGSSDKRDSNDKIGGFGLGSKSGLGMASQFTVSAVKDGKRNTVIVMRREDGHPVMKFLDEQDATGESNGVRVTIPTTETYKFARALSENFFMGWEPGSVLIDGEAPQHHVSVHDLNVFTPVTDLGWRVKKGNAAGFRLSVAGRALVNGVSYTLDLNQVEGLDHNVIGNFLNEVVIKLENGSVEIHPSRETLIYDKRTREYITKRVMDLVASAPTIREALKIRQRAISFGFHGDYTYQGEVIEMSIPKTDAGDELAQLMFTDAWSANGYSSRSWTGANTGRDRVKYRYIMDYHMDGKLLKDNTVLVTGATPGEQPDTPHREGINIGYWAKAQNDVDSRGLSRKVYFTDLTDLSGLSKWFVGSFDRIITAEEFSADVTAMKKARAAQARAASKNTRITPSKTAVRLLTPRAHGGSFYVEVEAGSLTATDKHILLKNVTPSQPWTLEARAARALTTKVGYEEHGQLANIAMFLTSRGYKFIVANATTDTSAYNKIIPNLSTSLKTVIEREAASMVKSRSEIQKRAILDRAEMRVHQWAVGFTPKAVEKINNSDLRDWITAINEPSTSDVSWLEEVSKYGTTYGIDTATSAITSTVEGKDHSNVYPLLKALMYCSHYRAMADYINLVDAEAEREAARLLEEA
jgi:Histidine kinase-, DNA gyrase B-, and HSP90-like ATPase